ncbi:MAG: hypothetical protein UW15_C0018G0011 [Parcubacteria group bacterium GW2011_GWC1_44_10]|uniref:Uncharacterized protein n=1 Tax=Candidatus Giovannonibacteria bacterium GW2011_GWA1_44_25 TaxID=1618645 RepID=A0A0G1IIY0_9BACT|nr:MAG: hypothetical protein UW15_C0018G0011 [Parcubacteria group bacterium GW2011_GWC1_44_10]KKT59331.1 MAG: hypothetical protein UW53_C0015G0014 [Candidatus Giovannonibacteria bacterium GW2011_GWA1_44_25]
MTGKNALIVEAMGVMLVVMRDDFAHVRYN